MNRITLTFVSWAMFIAAASGDHPSNSTRFVPTLPGLIEPKQQVTLSAPVEGVIADVWAQDGDRLEVNATLARFDVRKLQQDLHVAEVLASNKASLTRTKHALSFAERSLKRFQGMHKSAAVSEKTLDEAHTTYEIAKANYELALIEAEAARARCDVVRAEIDIRTITAPFSGRVLRVFVQPGQALKTGDPIASLANLDAMRVDLYLPVNLLDQIHPGQKFRLAVTSAEENLVDARLVSFEPVVNAGAGVFRARFEFDNRTLHLPAGCSARLLSPNQADGSPTSGSSAF